MIGKGAGDGYGNGLETLDSADWEPAYPVPREAPEKSIGKLVTSQNRSALLMFQTNMLLALTMLGLMLLLSGMLVVGVVFLIPSASRTLQRILTQMLYKQAEI